MGEPPYAMAGSVPNCLVLGSAINSMGALAPMVRFARAARSRSPISNARWERPPECPPLWCEVWPLWFKPGRNCQAVSRCSSLDIKLKPSRRQTRRVQPVLPWRRPPRLATPAMGGNKHRWGPPGADAAWSLWDTSRPEFADCPCDRTPTDLRKHQLLRQSCTHCMYVQHARGCPRTLTSWSARASRRTGQC